jgi:hypothetical protein
MDILSTHEAIVWWEFHHGKSTSDIASEYEVSKPIPEYILKALEAEAKESGKKLTKKDRYVEFSNPVYVSKVLNRAREKISKSLKKHAISHRLDIEPGNPVDYRGILRGFDYQANTRVYIIYTLKLGLVVWYKHDDWAGKLCPECPKEKECEETLDIIMTEYNLSLMPYEQNKHMTEQSISLFERLASKEIPRYRRTES